MSTPRTNPIPRTRLLGLLGATALLAVSLAIAASTVPTDVQIPGTQPVGVDNPPIITGVGNCGCHDFTSANNIVPTRRRFTAGPAG